MEQAQEIEAINRVLKGANNDDENFYMPFGKFKGERLSDIALMRPTYLEWVLTLNLDSDLRLRIRRALKD